jgi:23S rRNA pseudouridine1911/1915/1917 synthase
MPVHRTGKIFFQTLANLMRERLQDSSWSPLNRLDRETSGVVAFARGPEAFRSLAPDSPTAEWTKLYMAIVRGRLPSASAGVGMGMEVGILDQPVGPQTGDAIRCRMHVHLHGKPATSLYQTMAHSEGLSLVVLSPVTGRKHQLRVHLAHAGCPVVGDKIYSGDGQAYLKRLEAELDEEDYAALGAKRHLLHAFYLRIKTPDHEIHEAWDWEPGPEFLQNFPNENPSTWHASGKLDQILSQVQKQKQNQMHRANL